MVALKSLPSLHPAARWSILPSERSRTWVCWLVVLGLFAMPASSGVQAADPVLTPHRVAVLRSVSSAVISPDGSQIAYILSVPRQPGVDDDGEPWSELWVIGSREGAARPFITGKVNVSEVEWTPDGRALAFLAKRGEGKNKALHVIPIDGGEARKAVELATDISGYTLAPDGQRVAVIATAPEAESRKKLSEKGFKAEIYEEDWRFAKLWLTTLFATKTPASPVSITGHLHQVHWSPTDDQLLVSLAPTPGVDDGMMRQEIRVVDGPTGRLEARIPHAGKLGALAWSPDGRHVAFIGSEDVHDPQAGRLWVATASGDQARDLIPGLEGHVTDFAWAGPDTIACVIAAGTGTRLDRVTLSGVVTRGLASGDGGPVVTGWSLAEKAPIAALVASTPAHPAELYVWTPGETAALRRTDSNPDLAGRRLARQEVIRHRARDGLELEGLLIRPLDEEPGRRYPLILAVHGGPEAHVSHGWLTSYSLPGQVAAARGFAVFHPNYRGSTGRGVAFSKLGQGDAAGKEFDDLVDAVDHLVSMGLVDRDKVGVTGGSYGGYATAWCSTRYSDRFAAGVMFVGISDKISKVGTTDIPEEEYLVHARKRPWEDWQFLLERSPIFHAGRSRTPLLILHGKDDPRVNVGQSRELYRHLKMHNQAPVRLVLYPGEVHGNRKAAARLDYSLRMLGWMEHYLKGPGGPMPAAELDYADPAAAVEPSAGSPGKGGQAAN